MKNQCFCTVGVEIQGSVSDILSSSCLLNFQMNKASSSLDVLVRSSGERLGLEIGIWESSENGWHFKIKQLDTII